MCYSDIENPEEIITENFLEHLRMIFYGNLEFAVLLQQVQLLMRVFRRKII
jgi:hypothetical protein